MLVTKVTGNIVSYVLSTLQYLLFLKIILILNNNILIQVSKNLIDINAKSF